MPHWTPSIVAAAVLTLLPLAFAAAFPQKVQAARIPAAAVFAAALLSVPYILVSTSTGTFHAGWLILYASLPVAVAAALYQAGRLDPKQRGTLVDYAVLLVLGAAVDLRWFQPAWPARLIEFNKILLVDAGIYGFLAIRKLDGTGFSLRLRPGDLWIGLREVAYYAPIALALGLGLGFLHLHSRVYGVAEGAGQAIFAWCFTFVFIAIPEELFFRGWLQNLLERRIGRYGALLLTSALFGLSHFNKRSSGFNWRYVLLAGIAGMFYGRAWRSHRRVGASVITHATVDTLWSLFLR